MKPPKLKTLEKASKEEKETKIDMKWEPDHRPYISFDSEQLPEIASWKVGNKYMILLEVEQKSVNISENKNKKTHRAEFIVTKVGPYTHEKKEAKPSSKEQSYNALEGITPK